MTRSDIGMDAADFNCLLSTDPCAKQAWKSPWKCRSPKGGLFIYSPEIALNFGSSSRHGISAYRILDIDSRHILFLTLAQLRSEGDPHGF